MSQQAESLRQGHCGCRFSHPAFEEGDPDSDGLAPLGPHVFTAFDPCPGLRFLQRKLTSSPTGSYGAGWGPVLDSVIQLTFGNIAELCHFFRRQRRWILTGVG